MPLEWASVGTAGGEEGRGGRGSQRESISESEVERIRQVGRAEWCPRLGEGRRHRKG